MASKYRLYLNAKAKWFKRFVVLFSFYLCGFGVYLIKYHLRMRSLSVQYDCDFAFNLLRLRELTTGLLLAAPFAAFFAVHQNNRMFYVIVSFIISDFKSEIRLIFLIKTSTRLSR